MKYLLESTKKLDELKYELDEGIVNYNIAKRERELDAYILKNCYKSAKFDYTYLQSQKCEEFHRNNDYKLNLLNNFSRDHLWKHAIEYERCYKTFELSQMANDIDRDRSFLACHNKWIDNIESKVKGDLIQRATELFNKDD